MIERTTTRRAAIILAAATTALHPFPSAQAFDFDAYFASPEALSRDRAGELYAAALQHIAADYLASIAADETRALLDALESPGILIPVVAGLPGSIAREDLERFHALGVRTAAADGQLAVWVQEGGLRSGAGGIDIEMAAGRLFLAMVGRIRNNSFMLPGHAPLRINGALAAVVPDAATGIVVAVRSPADVLSEDPDARAYRRRPCPDGEHGFGIEEERDYIRRVKGTGDAEVQWQGPWREIRRNCMPEKTTPVVVAEQCPAPLGGYITHRINIRVIKHPDNPFGVTIERDPISSATEIGRNCVEGGLRLLTSTTTETETRSRQCSAVYQPQNPPTPPYDGNVEEERDVQVIRTWFDGAEADAIERRVKGAWRQVSALCGRLLERPVTRSRRRQCPAAFPLGDSQERETGTERYRNAPNEPDRVIRTAWNGDWTLSHTGCHRTWTQSSDQGYTSGCNRYRRTTVRHYSEFENAPGVNRLERAIPGSGVRIGRVSGCGNNNGGDDGNRDRDSNNGGGGIRAAWDTDNDGDLDTQDPHHPDVKDEDGNTRNPDGWSDGGDVADDGPGGGGCFLTAAIISIRGEPDDGPTLTTLREFRDSWLAETEEGRSLIAEYYLVSPRIVQAIPEGHPEWSWIADQVDAARDAILAGLNTQALAVYAGMVRTLQERWLSTPEFSD
ncbi:MAG: hypothetical protein OXF56_24725 [Rhodobacteraceae bacterium]|nr:hypothetical protein [Paracoccaceae bacterium]